MPAVTFSLLPSRSELETLAVLKQLGRTPNVVLRQSGEYWLKKTPMVATGVDRKYG
jgi:hypothetical protein